MKEGGRIYGKKHERKYQGRMGRRAWRGNLLRKGLRIEQVGGVPTVHGRRISA